MLAFLGAAGARGPAAAEEPHPAPALYQWSDDRGVVRYTAHLERVPRSALAGAIRIQRDPASGEVVSLRLGPEPRIAGDRPPVPAGSPGRAVESPGTWAIQLEATPLSPWVRVLEQQQLLAGRRLYRTTLEADGRVWQRLRLGFFPTLAAARAAAARLRPDFPGAWVDGVEPRELALSGSQSIELPSPRGSRGDALATPLRVAALDGSRLFAVQLRASPPDERLRALTRLELLERHRLYRTTVEAGGELWEHLSLGDFPSAEAAEAVRRQLQPSYPSAHVESWQPPPREVTGVRG